MDQEVGIARDRGCTRLPLQMKAGAEGCEVHLEADRDGCG